MARQAPYAPASTSCTPIGFDAFGLPAENAAIKHNTQAAEWTYKNMDQALATMRRMGFSYDMDRLVRTCDPDYYKWGQWIFEKLWERGLVYRKKSPVNWCPTCKTVLANEQVTEGKCWRCGSEPEKRDLEQWYFKITDYAQELLDDLEKLPGWPGGASSRCRRTGSAAPRAPEIDFTLCDAEGAAHRHEDHRVHHARRYALRLHVLFARARVRRSYGPCCGHGVGRPTSAPSWRGRRRSPPSSARAGARWRSTVPLRGATW